MRVAFPIHGDRISPVFDVARRLLLLDVNRESQLTRRQVRIETTDPVAKAKRVVELGSHVLICGAISRPLEAMLVAAGVKVIPNTCGAVEEVAAVFIAGDLTEGAFLMPGCTGRRHRHRHRHGRRS